MPMIETDSPQVIARAREQIALQADRARRHRDIPGFAHGSFMLVTGYLAALFANDLISSPMYECLARERVLAETEIVQEPRDVE